jgi:hypothetical protein
MRSAYIAAPAPQVEAQAVVLESPEIQESTETLESLEVKDEPELSGLKKIIAQFNKNKVNGTVNLIDQCDPYPASYCVPIKLFPGVIGSISKTGGNYSEPQGKESGIVLQFDILQKLENSLITVEIAQELIRHIFTILNDILTEAPHATYALITKKPKPTIEAEYYSDSFNLLIPGIKLSRLMKRYVITMLNSRGHIEAVFKDTGILNVDKVLNRNSAHIPVIMVGCSKANEPAYDIFAMFYIAEMAISQCDAEMIAKMNLTYEFSINHEMLDGIIKKVAVPIREEFLQSLQNQLAQVQPAQVQPAQVQQEQVAPPYVAELGTSTDVYDFVREATRGEVVVQGAELKHRLMSNFVYVKNYGQSFLVARERVKHRVYWKQLPTLNPMVKDSHITVDGKETTLNGFYNKNNLHLESMKEHMKFQPFLNIDTTPQNILNSFSGFKFPYEKREYPIGAMDSEFPGIPEPPAIIKHWIWHITNVLCMESELIPTAWCSHLGLTLLQWFGCLIQHPEVKLWCPVHKSIEGSGKTLFYTMISKMMGEDYMTTFGSFRQLCGDFNGDMTSKLLFVLNLSLIHI